MKNIKTFEGYTNKQFKNFEIIQKDNKFVLVFNGTKNVYELVECDVDSDLNNYRNWNPTNMNNNAGYAWLYFDMRPYRKYVKKGLLKGTKGGEFSVDFVSINDNQFNDNIIRDEKIDHIIVMKKSYYDLDEILELHTIFKIENNNIFKIDVEDFKKENEQ